MVVITDASFLFTPRSPNHYGKEIKCDAQRQIRLQSQERDNHLTFFYQEFINLCVSECIDTQHKSETRLLTCYQGIVISISLNWNPVYCSVGLLSSLSFNKSCHMNISFDAGTLQRNQSVQSNTLVKLKYSIFFREIVMNVLN